MADIAKLIMTGVDNWKQKIEDSKKRIIGMQAFLNRNLYPEIQNIQMRRWASEGASEGTPWASINPKYAQWKKRRFASEIGGGTKLLIATGRLVSGVIGPVKSGSLFGLTGSAKDHVKVVTDNSIFVGTTVPYARFVDEKRSIAKISADSKAYLYGVIRKYISGGLAR